MIKKIIYLLIGVLVLSGCARGTPEAEITSDEYQTYSQELYEEKLGNEKFILFFHADWCPLCRQLESKIKEDLSILNGHSVLEANFDREIELKKEFEVLAQTTVIFINEKGENVGKKVNPSIESIQEFFKN